MSKAATVPPIERSAAGLREAMFQAIDALNRGGT